MDSDEVQAVLDRASELLEGGRPAEALRWLEELEDELIDAADRIECASLQASALSELGESDEALDLLEPLIDEYPESGRLHAVLGTVLSNDGDLDAACAALEQAVLLDATDEVATANLGLVYERLREHEQALELYDQALELGGEIDWLLPRRAAVQAELGQVAAARSTLKRYLSLEPDDAEQWIALAMLHGDELQFEQAFRCYRAAEQIAPDSTALRLNWGVTAVRGHQVQAAVQQLKYLARLEPDSSRPLLLEAFIKEEQGDLRGAIQKYVEAVARVRCGDYAELTYALEMATDFFARRRMLGPCEQLLEQAYLANACTVELCEAYREATGELLERGNWYSVLVEGDYRAGLDEVADFDDGDPRPFTRFLRNYQVIASDHDEALALVLQFATRMGESNVVVREFVSEEQISDTHAGLYEVERQSLVFAADPPD